MNTRTPTLLERADRKFSDLISNLPKTDYYKKRDISRFRDRVLEKVSELNIPYEKILFSLVFPNSFIPLEFQIKNMIADPRGVGEIDKGLNLRKMENEFIFPKKPYFIFGIEPGKETEGVPGPDAEEKIKSKGLKTLTGAEVISISIFHGALEDRNLLALGSSYEDKNLLLRTNGEGAVKSLVPAKASYIYHERIGSPSCMHREVL